MGRRLQRVGRDVVVGVTKEVRQVEDEVGEDQQEDGNAKRILQRRVGREGHRIGLQLDLDAGRVRLARHMQRPDVQDHDTGDHEGQQVVQREEAVERRIVDGEAAEQEGLNPVADPWEGGEEAGDDGRPPEGHLAPGQNIAHEGGCHHQEVDDHAEDPEDFARRLVGTVVEAAGDVEIDCHEEEGRAVGMHVAQQPAMVDVADDLFDRVEGDRRIGRIMHGKHDAGQDLQDQHDGQHGAERVGIVQIARDRIGNETVIDHARQRKPRVDPFFEPCRWLVRRMTTHDSAPPSTDLDLLIRRERILRYGEVLRCRPMAYAAGGIVDRTMAGTEPPAVFPRLAERYAAEMGADADHHEPVFLALTCRTGNIGCLRIGWKVGIASNRILEVRELRALGIVDFLLRAVTDEDGLAAPLHRQRHARLKARHVDFDGSKSKCRCIRPHLVDKRPRDGNCANSTSHTRRQIKEIAARRLAYGFSCRTMLAQGCTSSSANHGRTAAPPH
ncbi:hypothetical protein RHSP_49335 [Rhizobium freirei PRF 81]|uniref:Uncharacterized protein n=1 Tax=Rhizobium freirei PRF 81 TaxID=363754 RepID=N6V227_9HYPH|nr:hypothetical protein RHSP_49335 [Rhizobium freirei PRF 81]